MIEIPRNASVWTCPTSETDALPTTSFRYVVKDCIDVKGLPTSCGTAPPANQCADRDAEVVSLLNAGGGKLVAKTNLDELALGCLGTNRHFGDVLNPVYPDYVSGGSSSGSAAMVAAGCVELGVGTDWGGSVRIPALCCGIYGLKLSTHHHLREGVDHIDPSMSAVGFFASKSEVLEQALDLIGAEEAPHDNELRAAIARVCESDSIDPDRLNAYRKAIDAAIDVGVPLTEVALPWGQARSCRKVLAAKALRDFIDRRRLVRSNLPAQALALLNFSETGGFNRLFDQAEGNRKLVREAVLAVMEIYPIIVCPGLGVPVPRVGDSPSIRRFSDHCTYFFEIANVADVSAVVFPEGGVGGGSQLLIRPGLERAALRWLRRLRITGQAQI